MDIDAALRARFASEAEAMEDQHLDLAQIIGRGKRARAGTRVFAVAAVATALAVTTFAVSSLTGSSTKGDTIPDPAGPQGQVTEALMSEADQTLTRFLKEAGDSGGGADSWELLTHDAQQRIGSLIEWNRERADTYGFLSWALAPDVDVVLTKFPPAAGDRFVATLVAKPEGARGLLQPVPLVHTADGFLIDLASTSFVRSVSLEPLNPRFMAATASADCSPGEDCVVELPEWPVVKDGDLFGVAIEPSEKIGDVWFAVGSEWVAAAELTISDGRVVAEATFEADGVTPGVQVFLVAIRTDDAFETYGYRVTYQE